MDYRSIMLIHVRPHLLEQARDSLNEGGYIELVDFE